MNLRKKASNSDKVLSSEELNDLKKKSAEILANCRRQILYKEPFIGMIAMQLDLCPIHDYRCDTACTDGKSIYFDIAFLESLSEEDRKSVLAHEVWHNVMLHFIRVGSRQRQIWNLATDMEVNQIIVNDGFSKPSMCVWPNDSAHGMHFPLGLNAEEYYELLMKNQPKNSPKSIDQHIYEGDRLGEEGSGNNSDADSDSESGVSDKYGKLGEDPDFQPSLTQEAGERIREAAVSAAQEIQRQKGDLPDHLKRLVGNLLEPEVPWRDRLAQFITRSMNGDRRCWSRPNRRHAWSGLYLPSGIGERIRIAVGIDTSGSCSEDLPRFLSEINGIVKAFGCYNIDVIQCDCTVQDHQVFNEDRPMDENELEHFSMQGGGGTAMMPIFNFVQEKELDVDALIIFTDGYIDRMMENPIPDLPVLWVLTKNGSETEIGFGEKIKLD